MSGRLSDAASPAGLSTDADADADADADSDGDRPVSRSLPVLKQGIAGVLMVMAGAAVLHTAWGYGIGSLTDMGAGYFPALLGGALMILGIIMLAGLFVARLALQRTASSAGRDDILPGEDRVDLSLAATARSVLRDIEWRGGVCILASIVAFVVIGQWAGLLLASFAVVFIAALGDRTNTVRRAVAIALVMTVISVTVFWWALQLQMPLLPWSH